MTKQAGPTRLQVRRSGELREALGYSVLEYGQNGTGKTFFAATWPRPLFIVPAIGTNELRTIQDFDLPFVVFESLDHLKEIVGQLKRQLAEHPGEYKTLVFDSLTTTQTMFEVQAKEEQRVDKLEWDGWGKLATFYTNLLKNLHEIPVHKIWICHTDQDRVFSLQGSSRQLFPNNADVILYFESRDLGGRTEYRVHPRRYRDWPARVRRSAGANDEGVPIFGPDPSPCYDDLAPYLGLRSMAEEEAD